MSNKAVTVYAAALKRRKEEEQEKPTRETTQNTTHPLDTSRIKSRDISLAKPRDKTVDNSRELLRTKARKKSRELPGRDEIQEFSFHLRDDLKVKVQAEVPHQWQKELEEMSRQLDGKKLELYRYIIGEFLGKVQRKK